MSNAPFPEVPQETDTFADSGEGAPARWSLAVRTAAFGAGAAALIGMATAFGPGTDALAGAPEVILPIQICHNSTCCVDPPAPPSS